MRSFPEMADCRPCAKDGGKCGDDPYPIINGYRLHHLQDRLASRVKHFGSFCNLQKTLYEQDHRLKIANGNVLVGPAPQQRNRDLGEEGPVMLLAVAHPYCNVVFSFSFADKLGLILVAHRFAGLNCERGITAELVDRSEYVLVRYFVSFRQNINVVVWAAGDQILVDATQFQ